MMKILYINLRISQQQQKEKSTCIHWCKIYQIFIKVSSRGPRTLLFPLSFALYVYSCIRCYTAFHWVARLHAYLTLSLHNTNKNLKLKAFVTNFIILLLSLESLLNLMRVVLFLIPQPEQPKISLSYNLTESCQINYFPGLVGIVYSRGWLLFQPYNLTFSLHLCILPIVTLLISVLKNLFLDKAYKNRIRIGLAIIFCRLFVCVFLFSIFQTQFLFYIPYMFLFAIDYFMYLHYARAFHQLLCSRRNEARIHRREDPQLFRERSYVLSQYRVTALYTVCVLSLYLLLVLVIKTALVIEFLSENSCYFNYITDGYIPTLQISIQAHNVIAEVYLGMFCLSFLAEYLDQLLLFVAYLTVCVGIVAKYLSKLRRQKRTQFNMAQVIDEYHRDFPAYRD